MITGVGFGILHQGNKGMRDLTIVRACSGKNLKSPLPNKDLLKFSRYMF